MPNPPPWPERPGYAQDFDLFWLVRRLPPEPFPDDSYDYAADPRFGPPGTVWLFSLESLYNRSTAPGASTAVKLAVERFLRKLGTKLPPAGSSSWATPPAFAIPAVPVELELRMPMNWIRTTIVGAVGTTESVAHGINWRHESIENAVPTPEVVKGLGDAVRDAWALYFNGQAGSFSPELRYTEVRSSFITLAGPGDWVEHGAGANQTEHPGADPEWPQPTQVSPFTPNTVKGTGTASLPYEVALALSFNTNFRGTSRFKGRLYLGPLSVGIMAAGGQFDRDSANFLAGNFGSGVFGGVIAATDYKPHVISEKFCTSAEIIGVRVGVTPDSQRRRRKSIPENYVQRWGVPVGGA